MWGVGGRGEIPLVPPTPAIVATRRQTFSKEKSLMKTEIALGMAGWNTTPRDKLLMLRGQAKVGKRSGEGDGAVRLNRKLDF